MAARRKSKRARGTANRREGTPAPAVKKKSVAREPSPAARAAITRAERAFAKLSTPGEKARTSTVERFEKRRTQLAGALRRAGFSAGQVSARIGAVTRRRNEREAQAAAAKKRRVRPAPAKKIKKRGPPPAPPKKKRRARPAPPPPAPPSRPSAPELPPPRPRRPSLSAAAEAAITRAERAFLALPAPRPYSRKAQVETYERRRQQFIDTMRRAGMTEAQIRARLAVVTRRRNQLRQYIREEIRTPALGTLRELHGSDPLQRAELQTRMIERDDSFLAYMEAMDDLGIGYDEAINTWFSP